MHTQDWAEACGLDTPEHSTSLAVFERTSSEQSLPGCLALLACWPVGGQPYELQSCSSLTSVLRGRACGKRRDLQLSYEHLNSTDIEAAPWFHRQRSSTCIRLAKWLLQYSNGEGALSLRRHTQAKEVCSEMARRFDQLI